MSILNPKAIHEVLKESGLTRTEKGDSTEIKDILYRNNLSPDDIIVEVGSMMRSGESDSIRLNAAKVGLELNGLLKKDDGRVIPTVIINIKDSSLEFNPILIPR